MKLQKFQKYMHKVIPVTEKPWEFTMSNGTVVNGVGCSIDDNDPTIAALKEDVKNAGLKLRLWLPDSIGTMDIREDRLNVSITKSNDGTFTISHMKIG